MENYLKNIFASIHDNAKKLGSNSSALKELVRRTNQFYVSLFSDAKGEGVFHKDLMDEELANVPEDPDTDAARASFTSTANAATSLRGRPRRGLGKGAPGCARKETVTKRQRRNRELQRKRKADEQQSSQGGTASQPKRVAAPTSTAVAAESSEVRQENPTTIDLPPPPPPSSSSSPSSPPRVEEDIEQFEHEKRQPLGAQVIHTPGSKSVTIIQKLAGARKDRQPDGQELLLFWQAMHVWETLDERLVRTLKQLQNDWTKNLKFSSITPAIIDQLVRYSNTSNGLQNCLNHIIGSVVKYVVDNNAKKGKNTQQTVEEIDQQIKHREYGEYSSALKDCGCDTCKEVLDFDDRYNT